MTKIHNHTYPAFHIKKWIEQGGRIYDKEKNKIRRVDSRHDFTEDFYYSLGENNSILEDRISSFETYIGTLIKKIDEAEGCVKLTGKELELLKLYGVLCANRQHFTSEVIISDESGLYSSNEYIFGTHRMTSQRSAVTVTEQIIDDFEQIIKLDDDLTTTIYFGPIIDPRKVYSTFTVGLHLVIFRNDDKCMCVSERGAIIENTLDSNHLYTYIPISPRTAICLVKSNYYLSLEFFEDTKNRFGRKYGNGLPDSYISEIFYNNEHLLFCSYFIVTSAAHITPTPIRQTSAKTVSVKITDVKSSIIDKFNAIFFEDGNKFLFCNRDALERAKDTPLDFRDVTLI